MAVSFGQFCINVSDLDRSIAFYEGTLGFKITHRIEQPGGMNLTEIVFEGESGSRLQIACHHDSPGPIEHGSALWKFYVNTDNCEALYALGLAAGAESLMAPLRLEAWPVTVAMICDPDGYKIELVEQ
ncbi:MAG: lactoylglutathione lyase, partial [Bacteroidia bacterium]